MFAEDMSISMLELSKIPKNSIEWASGVKFHCAVIYNERDASEVDPSLSDELPQAALTFVVFIIRKRWLGRLPFIECQLFNHETSLWDK